jgi:membrane-associated phospholipid phosphatase
MTSDPVTSQPGEIPVAWSDVWQALTRPYRVTAPMVILVLLVPFYLVIARLAGEGVTHAPAFAVDRLLPLVPAWALVYGALYAFLIVVPVFVVQQEELIQRTVWAYLMVWTVAYVAFLLYPTVAPRAAMVTVPGQGFPVWGLQTLYDADPPYNCFPSIHVAHSFVSALACSRVHRTLGGITIVVASLVALSTLFTKQHYVADLVAGILLALAAWGLFLRGYPRAGFQDLEHRVAPRLALCAAGIAALGVGIMWVAYRLGVTV